MKDISTWLEANMDYILIVGFTAMFLGLIMLAIIHIKDNTRSTYDESEHWAREMKKDRKRHLDEYKNK